jgi:uncharacterized membrane protein YkoI
MKINRLVGLAAIALLVVAAMGFVSMRVSAQSHDPVAPAGAYVEDDDTAEAAETGADVDDVEEQSGQQNEANDEAEDLDNGQVENEADDVSEAGVEGGVEDAPSGTPSITAEAAQQAAEAYVNAGTATQVELDDENGALVYSVEIGSSDVKVDAMTGAVLGVESGED